MDAQLASLAAVGDQENLTSRDVDLIDVQRLAIKNSQRIVLSRRFPLELLNHYTIATVGGNSGGGTNLL